MTTVVALLPMAMGLQGSSKSYGPFAASIAFGLLFAMIGTLFVIAFVIMFGVVFQGMFIWMWNNPDKIW